MYLPSLILRFLCIQLLISAIAASLVVPISIGVVLWAIWHMYDSLNERNTLIALVFALGLAPSLLMAIGRQAWDSFLSILKKVGSIEWELLPDWRVASALEKTWKYIEEAPRTALMFFLSGVKLSIAVFVIMILAMSAYFHGMPTEKSSVTPSEKSHVLVVSATYPKVGEIRQHIMQTGTTFSLVHLDDADASGRGICLDKYQQKWLKEFRGAISQCASEALGNSPGLEPEIEVVGFASSSPAISNGMDGDKVNCEFANRRAEAVAVFLADGEKGKWRCENMEEADTFRKAKELCDPEKDYLFHEGAGFKLKTRQWSLHSDMRADKPARDGHAFDRKYYETELLNRSVHIKVPENFCRSNA